LPSAVHEPINVAEDVAIDVAIDVAMNNQGVHTNPTIVIAAVRTYSKEILTNRQMAMQLLTQQSPNRRKSLCKHWRISMKDIPGQRAFWTRPNRTPFWSM
jgi:hypothetical protein